MMAETPETKTYKHMPHDQYGQQLSVGDEVDLRCRITQVSEGEVACNVTAEAVNRPDGEAYIPTIAGNSKFYRKVDRPEPTGRTVLGGTFGQAIAALKEGKRVSRSGWNGKGMYLWLLPATIVKAEWCREPHLKEVAEANGGEIEALGSIRMMTADKKVLTGWLASQTDMLAEDWETID